MTPDDGFENSFSSSLHNAADGLDVSPADADAVIGRGAQRKARTRAAIAGAGMVAVLAGVAGAAVWSQRAPSGDTRIEIASPDPSDDRSESDNTAGVGSGPDAGSIAIAPAGSSNLPPANGSVSVATLDTERVDRPVEVGWILDRVQLDDGTIYALSTAPAEAGTEEEMYGSARPALYTLGADGWSDPITDERISVQAIAGRGNRLYAVGTAPAASGAPDASKLVIGRSDDGAATWQLDDLPIDTSSVEAVGGDAFVHAAGLAATADGVVAAVVLNGWIDPAELPNELDGADNWRWDDDGLVVLVPRTEPPADFDAAWVCEPSAALVQLDDGTWACDGPGDGDTQTLWEGAFGYTEGRTFSWSELGLDPAIADVVLGSTKLFLIEDGQPAAEVEVPVPDGERVWSVELHEAADRIVMAVSSSVPYDEAGPPFGDAEAHGPAVRLFQSTDGRSWTPLSFPGSAGMWLSDLGELDGSTVALLQGEDTEVQVETDGGWVTTRLGALVDSQAGDADEHVRYWANHTMLDDDQLIVVMSGYTDPIASAGGVDLHDADGYAIRLLDETGSVQVTGPGGETLLDGVSIWGDLDACCEPEPDDSDAGRYGINPTDDGIEIVDRGEDGTGSTVLVTLSHMAVERAFESAYADIDSSPRRSHNRLLISSNGIDFTVAEVELEPGQDIAGVVVNGDEVMIRVHEFVGEESSSFTLVATLP